MLGTYNRIKLESSKINIDGLDNLKQWLLKSLEEGEDRYE